MHKRMRTTGATRIVWPLVLGLGLAIGLLLALAFLPPEGARAFNSEPAADPICDVAPHRVEPAEAPHVDALGEDGFVLNLAHNAVWGYVSPGETVTVTRTAGGAAYGAAEADGVGFFWTPLWQANGQPAVVTGGDQIEIYVDDALAATLNPLTVTGQVDVLNDRVVGTIEGASLGTPVTVTLGLWDWRPLAGPPQATAATDASGTFTATFTTDLGPHNHARVEYASDAHIVQAYLYPHQVFQVDTFSSVFGYAEPMQAVTVTLVRAGTPLTPTTTVANWPHGDYRAYVQIESDDVVEVDLGSGNVITTVASNLIAYPDAILDRVTGTCPASKTVRVWARDWSLRTYAEAPATADASGNYTATFSGYDLKTSDSVCSAFADDEGDEVLLGTTSPQIGVNPLQETVIGRVDGPNLPVTVSLNTGTEVLVETTQSQVGSNIGAVYFGYPPQDIQAGHVVTVETATWSGVMTVADVSLQFDTVGERVSGEADIPGLVLVLVSQWHSGQYPAHGWAAVTTTVSSPFTATFTGFDLRDGCTAFIVHRDANDFFTWVQQGLRYFEVKPPSTVGVLQLSDSDVLTATLYESDGVTVKSQTSEDGDDGSGWYCLGLSSDIAPGDWVTVTDGAGWTAGLRVPTLTVQADDDTDLIWGDGPKSLLLVEHGWDDGWDGRFVPVDGYVLDRAFFGGDIQRDDRIYATYQAPSGNRVKRGLGWLQMRVDYGRDIVGATYPAGHTFWITVTDGTGTLKATALVTTTSDGSGPGPGYWGQDGFYTQSDDWSDSQPDIEPYDWVHFQASDGYSNTVRVGEITGGVNPAADTASGTIHAPWFPNQTLWVYAGYWGFTWRGFTVDLDNTGTGQYFVDFSPEDLQPGDSINVEYLEPDGDKVSTVLGEPEGHIHVRVFYASDYVEGNTTAGATVWVTVTDSSGNSKDAASATAQESGEYYIYGLQGIQADIVPTDWVTATSSDGTSTTMQVIRIEGTLDAEADTISGTMYGPGATFPGQGRVKVHTPDDQWYSWDLTIDEAGNYSLDMTAQHDVVPGDEVQVFYNRLGQNQTERSFKCWAVLLPLVLRGS